MAYTLTEVCDHCGKGLGEHMVPDSRCPAPENATTYFFMAAYHPPIPSPYISTQPDNESPLVVDIHADGVRAYVDRKFSSADCRRLAQTLTDAAAAKDAAESPDR